VWSNRKKGLEEEQSFEKERARDVMGNLGETRVKKDDIASLSVASMG